MIKPDVSVQIHAGTGVKPRNWQPRTNGIHVELLSEHLVLTAERFKPDEMLRVTFTEVRSAEAIPMRAESSCVLEGSESDMRAALRGMIVAPDITQPAMKRLVELELEFVRVTALPQVEQKDEQGGLFS